VVAGANPDDRASEVHIAPVEREQLTAAQLGERRGQEDRRILLRAGRLHESPDLLGREDLDVTAAAKRRLLDVRRRVEREAPHPLRPLEDAVAIASSFTRVAALRLTDAIHDSIIADVTYSSGSAAKAGRICEVSRDRYVATVDALRIRSRSM
jgi:hypothetical protein